jgi:anti-anti-sigma factor
MKIQQRKLDDAVVVELAGEADLVLVPEFREILRARMKDGTRALVVDFSGVNFVSTPVWAVVVEYFKHTQKAGGGLALAGLQGRAEASFNIVRLGEFITHRPTVEEAVSALRS